MEGWSDILASAFCPNLWIEDCGFDLKGLTFLFYFTIKEVVGGAGGLGVGLGSS